MQQRKSVKSCEKKSALEENLEPEKLKKIAASECIGRLKEASMFSYRYYYRLA